MSLRAKDQLQNGPNYVSFEGHHGQPALQSGIKFCGEAEPSLLLDSRRENPFYKIDYDSWISLGTYGAKYRH